MPNIDSQLNKDSWGWELRLKFKKLCISWTLKTTFRLKIKCWAMKTPQAKVLCICCERWVNHCAQVRWWTTTSSPPPSSLRWAKEKHRKDCESCPLQVSWKVKFKCQSCSSRVSCLFRLSCLSFLSRLSCPPFSFLSCLTLFVVFLSRGSCHMFPQMKCLESLYGRICKEVGGCTQPSGRLSDLI